MIEVKFLYNQPISSPVVMTGLTINDPVIFDLGKQVVHGSFTPTQFDHSVPPVSVISAGSSLNYEIPLGLDDMSTIMNIILNRAKNLGLIVIPGTVEVIES